MEETNKMPQERPSEATERPVERDYSDSKGRDTSERKGAGNGSGGAIRKRRSLGRKLMDRIFSDDPIGVSERVKNEVVWPGLKDLGYNVLQSAISMMFWGEVRGGYGGRGSSRNIRGGYRDGYEDYSGYSRDDRRDHDRGRRRDDRRASYDYGEIIFNSKGRAEDALDYLSDLIKQYGHATVADLNERAELSSKYTDRYYGWYDLRNATVYPTPDGWMLDLPPTEAVSTR